VPVAEAHAEGYRRESLAPALEVVGRALVATAAGELRLTDPLALALRGTRVASVGPAAAAFRASWQRVGHADAILMPGLADSHIHLVATAASRLGIDLAADPPCSLAGLARRLAVAADAVGNGAWVRVGGFEPAELGERRLPTRDELDAWVPHGPLRLRHATRHASFLNTAAFERVERALGPLSAERAPRAADGGFSGVVYGLEAELTVIVGPKGREGMARALRATSAALAWRGVVRIDEVSGSNDAARAALLGDAIARGDLVQKTRLFVCDAEEAEAARAVAGERLEIAGVKLFARDAEDGTRARLLDAIARARRAGLPVAVHAVEPDCVQAVLDALAAAPPRAGEHPAPDRIEHASLCPPELARRLARAGVAVVTQPSFVVARGDKYRSEVEEVLWPWLYPLRTLIGAGVCVAAGSDAPVGPMDPRVGLRGATVRRTAQGELLGAAETVGDATALGLYTWSAARARGIGASAAWWAPGSPADIVVLERDPRRSGWRDLEAAAVVVGGTPFAVRPSRNPGGGAAADVTPIAREGPAAAPLGKGGRPPS
jgi:predicted amidohydrolase YtcJ